MDNNGQANWAYKPESEASNESIESSSAAGATELPQESVSWTASEFIEHHKDKRWYTLFFLGIAMLSGLVFLITKDYFSAVFIFIAAVAFAALTGKKPRQLTYELSPQGLQIGAKFYDYESFKSFDIAQEGVIRFINLIPLKRFMPEVSIYFPPEQENKIVEILASHLPHDEKFEKGIDRLLKKLHL